MNYKTKSKVYSIKLNRMKAAVVMTAILLILCSSIFGSIFVSAKNSRVMEPISYTYYKSIEIQPGDTLWSIAETYITEDFQSVPEYVAALKKMNSLSTDQIHQNQFLTVAYNDTEFH